MGGGSAPNSFRKKKLWSVLLIEYRGGNASSEPEPHVVERGKTQKCSFIEKLHLDFLFI